MLVDTERLTVGLEARLLTELGWEMDADEVVRRWMGRTSKTQLAEVEAQLGPERAREFERRTDVELLEIFERELLPVEGVADLVERGARRRHRDLCRVVGNARADAPDARA